GELPLDDLDRAQPLRALELQEQGPELTDLAAGDGGPDTARDRAQGERGHAGPAMAQPVFREGVGRAKPQARAGPSDRLLFRAPHAPRAPYSFHPARYSRLRNLLASLSLVMRKFGPSQTSRFCARMATLPSSTVSVSMPA